MHGAPSMTSKTANRANRYGLAFLNDLRAELKNLVPDNFLALYIPKG